MTLTYLAVHQTRPSGKNYTLKDSVRRVRWSPKASRQHVLEVLVLPDRDLRLRQVAQVLVFAGGVARCVVEPMQCAGRVFSEQQVAFGIASFDRCRRHWRRWANVGEAGLFKSVRLYAQR